MNPSSSRFSLTFHNHITQPPCIPLISSVMLLAQFLSHGFPRIFSPAAGLTTLHYRGQRDTAHVHLTPGHASLLHLLKPSRPVSSSVHFSLRGKRVLIWMASCCLFPISRLLAHVTTSSRRTHQGPRVSTWQELVGEACEV